MTTTKIMLQQHGLAAMAGYNQPINDNRRKMRIEDVDMRIAAHEHHIQEMLNLAIHCRDSKERGWIAKEIGYSRLEIECCLKPLKERLNHDGTNGQI